MSHRNSHVTTACIHLIKLNTAKGLALVTQYCTQPAEFSLGLATVSLSLTSCVHASMQCSSIYSHSIAPGNFSPL